LAYILGILLDKPISMVVLKNRSEDIFLPLSLTHLFVGFRVVWFGSKHVCMIWKHGGVGKAGRTDKNPP
jgi:hypothetical protein